MVLTNSNALMLYASRTRTLIQLSHEIINKIN